MQTKNESESYTHFEHFNKNVFISMKGWFCSFTTVFWLSEYSSDNDNQKK